MLARRPKGYVGLGHETIGSDIQSVLFALNFPRNVLGAELASRLEGLQAESWYPVGMLLELMEILDGKLGSAGLQKLGRTVFRNSHEARVRPSLRSARDVVEGIDGMYRHANRGQGIGGWELVTFAPGQAVLEKTTPHHCAMEEGILLQALGSLGVPARVDQPVCFRRGDTVCRLVITADVTDGRWDHTRT